MKLYNITNKALKEYRTEIKNNKSDSKSLARKKLTRNIHCGRLIYNFLGYECFGYGSMRIYVLGDTVIHIENKVEPRIQINFKLKEKLNKELGIDAITFGDKIKRMLRVG